MENHHGLIVGRSGFGKSTFQKNRALDIMRGGSAALLYIDPHGPDARDLLDAVPRRRIRDTVYIEPTDACPVGFNPLPSPEVAVAGLKSIWIDPFLQPVSGWGPQMEWLLLNGLYVLHENEGATFRDLPRLYHDRVHRARLLAKVSHPDTLRFWLDEYPSVYEGSKDNPAKPILNKIGQLIRSPIARVLCQRYPKLDLISAIRDRRIIIVNLNAGVIGDEGVAILGSLITTCARHALKELNRVPADVAALGQAPLSQLDMIADEFPKYGTTQYVSMLSEDRKFGLTLSVALQYFHQIDVKLRDSILGNVAHKVIFNVEPKDAALFADGYRRATPGAEHFNPANFTELLPFEAYVDGRKQTLPPFAAAKGKYPDALAYVRRHLGRAMVAPPARRQATPHRQPTKRLTAARRRRSF